VQRIIDGEGNQEEHLALVLAVVRAAKSHGFKPGHRVSA
jgi:hypothetical protein